MAVPQKIKNLANKVRSEIYGKNVRESIAESMEETGAVSDEANMRSIDTQGRQDHQESRWDVQVGNLTEDSEILDARVNADGSVTYDNVKKRLDDEHHFVLNRIKDIEYNIRDFGAEVDDTTDDSNAYQYALNTISSRGGGVLKVPGRMKISKTINLPSNVITVGHSMAQSVISTYEGVTPFKMFDTTQGGGNRMWFGFNKIRIDARNSSIFMTVNHAYYYFFDEVQIDGHEGIDGLIINETGFVGYHGIFNKVRFNHFRRSVKGYRGSNANRFNECWFYGGLIPVEIVDANGNTFAECTFQDYKDTAIWLNDSGDGETTRNVMRDNYFEPVADAPSVTAGIRLSGQARFNEFYGGKYSNLRGKGKPEILYDNDYVKSRNLRMEYNGQSRFEVMTLPNFIKFVEFEEASKPLALDEYLGSISYMTESAKRDKLRAVLRESTGTRYWASMIYEMNGIVNYDEAHIQNVRNILQMPTGYMRLGRKQPDTPVEGDMYFDNDLKRVRVFAGGVWRSLSFE